MGKLQMLVVIGLLEFHSEIPSGGQAPRPSPAPCSLAAAPSGRPEADARETHAMHTHARDARTPRGVRYAHPLGER